MSNETEHNHPHRTLRDVLEHRGDCPACAAIIEAQKKAILEMLEQHRPVLNEAVSQVHEFARRSAHALRALLPPPVNQAAMRDLLLTLNAASKSLERMLRRSVRLGHFGWLVPDEISIDDFEELLRNSTTAESADRTFEAIYGYGAGPAFDELKRSMLSHDGLRRWRELLEDVFFALDAAKHRLCVPALFAMFEGVAAEGWHQSFHKRSSQVRFFNATLRRLEPDSLEFYEWRTMAAFVETMYKTAGRHESKPARLNRHWIMHGRGIPDANLSDCLRLLLAVRAAAEMAEHQAG